MNSWGKAFWAVIHRDLRLAWRQGGGGMLAVAFFVLTITLTAIGIGPATETLSRVAPGMLWVMALLATLLSLDRLFQADFEDGSLDQMALMPLPLEAVVLAKVIAHWLTTGLPILVISPVLGLLLALPGEGYGLLMLALLTGTPALSAIGAIGAGLTVGIRRGGVLLSLLVLPLYVPVLIFGTAAVDAAIYGLAPGARLAILAAMSLVALVFAPVAAAAGLRLHQG